MTTLSAGVMMATVSWLRASGNINNFQELQTFAAFSSVSTEIYCVLSMHPHSYVASSRTVICRTPRPCKSLQAEQNIRYRTLMTESEGCRHTGCKVQRETSAALLHRVLNGLPTSAIMGLPVEPVHFHLSTLQMHCSPIFRFHSLLGLVRISNRVSHL